MYNGHNLSSNDKISCSAQSLHMVKIKENRRIIFVGDMYEVFYIWVWTNSQLMILASFLNRKASGNSLGFKDV